MSKGTAYSPFSQQLVATAHKAFSPVLVAYSAYTDVASPIVAPAKTADRVHADYARLRSLLDTWDKPFAQYFTNL